MKKNICIALVATMAIFSLSACGKTESNESGTTTAPLNTTEQATTAAAQYEALPDQTVELTDFEGTVFTGENYTMKISKNFVQRETTGIDFFQIDGTNTQINVVKDTIGKTSSLDDFLTNLTQTYDSIDGYDAVSAGKIKLNNFDGIVINYTISGSTADSSKVIGRQIVIDCDGEFYALTYSTVDADFTEHEAEAMAMFSTFSKK